MVRKVEGWEGQGTNLGVHQPAMIERDVQQVEDDALGRVLEDTHPRELHVDVQACLQLVQDSHGVTHVLRGEGA